MDWLFFQQNIGLTFSQNNLLNMAIYFVCLVGSQTKKWMRDDKSCDTLINNPSKFTQDPNPNIKIVLLYVC